MDAKRDILSLFFIKKIWYNVIVGVGKMLKKISKILLVLCLIVSNFYIPSVNAAEDKTFGQVKKELAEYKKKYEENKLEQQLTEEEREKVKTNIKNTETAISDNQKEIYELEQEMEKLNADILEKEKEIENIMAFVQVSNGESAYLEYAFGAQTFTDFIYRVAISEQLTSYNNSLVEQYEKDIETAKAKAEELALKIQELEAKQKTLKEELIKIGNDLEGLTDDAVTIERQIELVESQLEVFEMMGCEDNETIKACAASKVPYDTGFTRPLEKGYISGYPGPRCILGSCSTHHGLDMSASGANYIDYPVYPIANGVVIGVYYEYNGGKKIYIQHNIKGKLYVSAYWHLRRIDVKKGDVVTRETQIAIMGGNESYDNWSTGAHLHLELSESDFNEKNYYSTRADWLHPEYYINFPDKYVTWYNRTTKY